MEDVSVLYAGRESEDFLARDPSWVTQIKTLAFLRLARRLVAFAQVPPKLIVDFGTGNGMLARSLAAIKSDARVFALDFFSDPPGPMEGAAYLPFEKASSLTGKVDLLVGFHVLEHDDNPGRLLHKMTDLLRPGGTAILEVPNIDCVWTPWFGTACANWYAPFHRVHFSRRSLAALFTQHGLEIVDQQNICGPTIAFSLANRLGCKPGAPFFAVGLLFRPVQWLAEKLTGRPSALRIVVRKPAHADTQ
jgi:2-polyprenyl-3-methyl-5-hydroxy-6-metoxy-1,4-benzoquinol methylase